MTKKETAHRVELTQAPEQEPKGDPLIGRDINLVKNVPVSLGVELGETELSIEQLFSLKSGEVLSLNKEVDEPVLLTLNGNVIAKGSLVAIDGMFGVEITEIQD